MLPAAKCGNPFPPPVSFFIRLMSAAPKVLDAVVVQGIIAYFSQPVPPGKYHLRRKMLVVKPFSWPTENTSQTALAATLVASSLSLAKPPLSVITKSGDRVHPFPTPITSATVVPVATL